jgi:hypothetical protein
MPMPLLENWCVLGLKDVKEIAKLHTNNAIFNSVGCDRSV